MENRTITVNKTILKRNYGVVVRKGMEQKGKKEEKSAWYFNTPPTQWDHAALIYLKGQLPFDNASKFGCQMVVVACG